MQEKVDFDIHITDALKVSDVKLGQEVFLEEVVGAWTCSTGSSTLGEIPPAVAANLGPLTNHRAVIRSVKRSPDDPNLVSSVQIRVGFSYAEQPQPLVQAEPPAEDPAGFILSTTELERLAFNEEFRTTLKDARLQELLLRIDGAANREQALKQALETPHFRDLADRMLGIMKPSQYPPA